MINKKIAGTMIALIALTAAAAPALAQFYVNTDSYGNPYHQPYYNDYTYRNYTPYDSYGYVPSRHHYRSNTSRSERMGAGIGAIVGLFAGRHGHRYDD